MKTIYIVLNEYNNILIRITALKNILWIKPHVSDPYIVPAQDVYMLKSKSLLPLETL